MRASGDLQIELPKHETIKLKQTAAPTKGYLKTPFNFQVA